ncbi:hypothetical protein B0H15DRAFT_866302 [Mycena belliarum]|uniref:Uncharacterized protein n=1 Tax=Mycena belliarum TaxID=1033014 RepID=A0AAD6TQT0_9AGAR|nr:hypothetical protein B0H15DRAFT_866302 [Mycena belliae]
MDCQFSFGPNGAFFCTSDSVWAWSDNNTLPEPLRLILEDPNHPQANKLPYDVAFPMEHGQFSMSWKTVKGEDYYEELFLGPRYSRLAEFMRKVAQQGEHCTRTVFGPNASYFTTSPSGFSWQNLPPVLESDILGRMKKAFPTNVALGVHGAFVVLYGDGNVTFDVATHYPAVDALIRNSPDNARRKGIAYIALSPHAAGQYYVAYGDGSASWNLPNDWTVDVTTVSKSLRPVTAARVSAGPPHLGGLAVSTGGTSAPGLPTYAASEGQSTPASPTPSATSVGIQAAQGLGRLWNAYQQQQQEQQTFVGNSSNFTAQFDPSTVSPGFDPSAFANTFGTVSFDPSSLATGLDPANVIDGAAALGAALFTSEG